MRRHIRSLIIIVVLVAVAGAAIGFQRINVGGFERGGVDTPLGLSLGLDLQGGSHLVYEADLIDEATNESITPTLDQMEALRRTIERRINASGLGEPILQLLGDDRILIQLPGVRDPGRAKELIGQTARLEFKHRTMGVPQELGQFSAEDVTNVTVSSFQEAIDEARAAADAIRPADEEAPEIPELTPEQVQANTLPVVIVEFTDEGAIKFGSLLAELNQSVFARTSPSQIPDSLEVTIEGETMVRFALIGLSISRIGESNRFFMPYPQPVDADPGHGGPDPTEPTEPNQVDVNEARALIGTESSVFFTQLQGVVDEDINLTGANLSRAYPSQHSGSGIPIVNLEFDSDGTKIFGDLTGRIAGSPTDRIAIFLDDEELIAPVVQTAITTGTAIIQGQDFTLERVRDISLLLESGRLPVPIELIQERDVDAILGADSLEKSVIAGGVGLLLVFLFMILYYRLPGLIAAVALLIYAALVLATFKILPVTLTLSGVAATILSVGMAVDANILIFERTKDELRAGRTLASSINIGFNRAWPAIRDSNASTLITCAILFWFAGQLGTTVVQGFAVTLAIGVGISMFSAIVVSRTLLRIIATTGLSRKYRLFVPSSGSELPQLQTATPSA